MMKATRLFAILLMVAALNGSLLAQNVNVTFTLSTASIPDTVGANSVVQMRGDTPPLTWDNGTGGVFTRVGGDYWTVTLSFPANTNIQYKYFVNAQGDGNGNGWETNVGTGSTNRELSIGGTDLVVPVQYYNVVNGAPQNYSPFVATDSLDIWFRVNVQRLIQDVGFDPATRVMGVRGGGPGGSDLSWGNTTVLTAENPDDNNQFGYPADFFYSGRVRVPNDSTTAGNDVFYKFVIGDISDPNANLTWENTPDRPMKIPQGLADTTVYFSYWEDRPPLNAVGEDTVTVSFLADMSRAINEGGFSIGDTLIVNWGLNGTAQPATDTLTNVFLTNLYELNNVEAADVELGKDLQYQYQLVKRGSPEREIFYDFTSTTQGSEAEKRKLFVPDMPTGVIAANDTVNSETSVHRLPRFRNTDVVGQNVTVTWTVDLRPAYWQVLNGDTLLDIQGSRNVTVADSVIAWGVWMNGPAAGGWTGWGADLFNAADQKMHDDGASGGDVAANDSIYSVQFFYSPDSTDIIGQVLKFGINGGDNEGGFGNNHVENIPQGAAQATVHSQFGSINPPFYCTWDYTNMQRDPNGCMIVGIGDEDTYTVIRYPELSQNYPNPFNPSTDIRFQLPSQMEVTLKVYNVTGQEVTTLVTGRQNAGLHIVNWNGRDKRGNSVATGVYFYHLKAGDYTLTRKMMLVK